ncbi:MAG: organic solvent tolerance protein OstA [Bacteroidetes bacterium]|nr:organic solvent tolerance protein OstA [Bacteroidota bacterium]
MSLTVTPRFSNAQAQETKKIKYDAEEMYVDEHVPRGAKRLLGKVVFIHEGVIMHCDSADFYDSRNSLEAYNNVHINQGDSIDLYGDYLEYDGNTRLAKVRYNVKLIQDSAYLVTDSLNYDRIKNMAWYEHYGKMVDSTNTLESINGYYYTDLKDFYAIDSVVLRNPEYNIFSDTLKYNTNSEIAYFFGPTEIISDSNYIYCENGWYNTIRDIAEVSENAFLKNSKQILKGDSIYYERHHHGGKGYGEAFSNVYLTDTVEKVILRSNYAQYFEEPERALLVDSAWATHVYDNDSIFLHADTLRSIYDTAGDYKILKAYYKAKMFKCDFQGKSDSIVYSFRDSLIQMFHNPVLWSEENQITASYIEIHTRDGDIDFTLMKSASMVVSQEDSLRYNQIRGRDMTGYFRDQELYKIHVEGNGETVYFAKDDDGLIGVNKATGSNMDILLKDSEVNEIMLRVAPEGTMNPIDHLPASELKLQGFRWLDNHRPRKKEDIFIWITNE